MDEGSVELRHHADATVEVTSWDRKPFDQIEGGPMLSRVSFGHAFSGGIEREGILEYVMAIGDGGAASYVGLERVRGRIGEREGSFVLQHSGTFEGGMANVTWFVVPGSGTGALRGLRGRGGFNTGHSTSYDVTLDYDFVGR
jgi:hypothetical protein